MGANTAPPRAAPVRDSSDGPTSAASAQNTTIARPVQPETLKCASRMRRGGAAPCARPAGVGTDDKKVTPSAVPPARIRHEAEDGGRRHGGQGAGAEKHTAGL